MAIESPQAIVRSVRSTKQLLKDNITSQTGTTTKGPRLVTAAGPVFEKARGITWREMQNCGIVPVKYLVDNNADCSANNFHGILAAGNAVDDGLGSVRQFNITGDRVTVFVDSGAVRVCTFEISAPEGQGA